MKLVVGLGNPGNKYNWTRHNVGFLALDYYFKLNKIDWKNKPQFGAICGRIDNTWFIKPQEYYNESGRAVREFMRFYKIPAAEVLVICDNFDLEFGKIRYRSVGVAGGNNGLRSIDLATGTNEYPRARIGTKNDDLRREMGDVDFVLSKFTPEEKNKLPAILQKIAAKIDFFREM